jgi:hypothetical protein
MTRVGSQRHRKKCVCVCVCARVYVCGGGGQFKDMHFHKHSCETVTVCSRNHTKQVHSVGRIQYFLMLTVKNGDKSDHVSIRGYAEYNKHDGNNHHFEGENVDVVTQINRSTSTTSRMVTSRTR